MEYAKSLIKRRAKKNSQNEAVEDDEAEESWTFVGRDEPDPEHVTKKLSDGLAEHSEKAVESQVLATSAVAT